MTAADDAPLRLTRERRDGHRGQLGFEAEPGRDQRGGISTTRRMRAYAKGLHRRDRAGASGGRGTAGRGRADGHRTLARILALRRGSRDSAQDRGAGPAVEGAKP